MCLKLLRELHEDTDESKSDAGVGSPYSVHDFGTSNHKYEVIHPLGLENVVQVHFGNAEFWCSDIVYSDVASSDGAIRLYPVHRLSNYKDTDVQYVSTQTKALMYTLGVCYIIDLFLFLSYFITQLKDRCYLQMRKLHLAMPMSILFAILCVFRICFMFMYPNGIFENEPLSEFVVFEIPTFLLFTLVIVSIGFWERLSSRSSFFVHDSMNIFIYIGVFLVWCLWIIVTVVYSEVILGFFSFFFIKSFFFFSLFHFSFFLETTSGKSPCIGRVPDSNEELEKNTRTLAIVYQSIIISVTFFLVLVFLYYTHQLLVVTQYVNKVKKFIHFIGGLITFSFLIRCLLYIIILAVEFTSSIYLFIVLFLTEVLVMFFAGLLFHKKTKDSSTIKFTTSVTPQSCFGQSNEL